MTCLRKSFRPQGRATRAEFWWFFPVGLVPPVVTAIAIEWVTIENFDLSASDILGVWRFLLVMFVAAPLLSSMSRRLHDIGYDGTAAYYPFMPFFIMWAVYLLLLGFSFALPIIGGIAGLFALYVMPLAYLISLAFGAVILASLLGHMLIPSEIGPNKYGPNPHEVTP